VSGHNKWSKIKRQKGSTDAAKSKIFGKMGALIASESKRAKGDTSSPSLRAVIEKAQGYNMPKDTIERAVKKGLGADAETMDVITYEAYGPGGSALIIEALTTNRNKASQEIKHILAIHGFELATPGSATWAFKKEPTTNNWRPTMTLPLSLEDEAVLKKLINDLEENEEVQDVYTNAE